MLAAHQRGAFISDGPKERRRDIRILHPLAVAAKGRRVEGRLHQVHVQKPAKEKVVFELLTKLSLAPHRVQGDEQQCLEQPLRGDRWPATVGVHRIEVIGQTPQRRVGQFLDATQRVVRRDTGFEGQQAEHGGLGSRSAAHLLDRSQRPGTVHRFATTPRRVCR
jgi:hypothetical protein